MSFHFVNFQDLRKKDPPFPKKADLRKKQDREAVLLTGNLTAVKWLMERRGGRIKAQPELFHELLFPLHAGMDIEI